MKFLMKGIRWKQKVRQNEEKLVSKAIQFFRPTIDNNDAEKSASKKTHICTLCHEPLNGRNESNLSAHLSSVHNELYQQLASQDDHPIVQRLKILQNLVEIATINGRPFNSLLDSGFRKLLWPELNRLEKIGYGINLSDKNLPVVKEHLQLTAKKIRAKISAEVKGRLLSLMVDIVTKFERSILGISIQYSANGMLKVRSVGMIELIASHTGNYQAAKRI